MAEKKATKQEVNGEEYCNWNEILDSKEQQEEPVEEATPDTAADVIVKDEQEFTVSGGVLIKYKDTASNKKVVIPSGKVTSIGEGCFLGNEGVEYIAIPNSVTSIGKNAFKDCKALSKVIIPDSVTSIGESAFSGCLALEKVTIPFGVTSISDYAFYGCSSLKELNLHYEVISIGESSFNGCSSLPTVGIPNSVTDIGKNAFMDCSSINRVEMSENLNTISEGVFSGCESLREFPFIGDNIKSIGKNAFKNCVGLYSVKIPKNVKTIGDYAFNGCGKLETVEIPESVLYIGDYAFHGTTWFSFYQKLDQYDVKLKSDYWNINDAVLMVYRRNAANVTITNCKSIYSGAFAGKNMTEVTLPEGVKIIGGCAFANCANLITAYIPDSVEFIAEDAFVDCDNLEKAIYKGQSYSIDYIDELYEAINGDKALPDVITQLFDKNEMVEKIMD